ncbi:MAG: hypothetical protein COS99_03810 [Candidatus Omnitrophica bacterium CG07_land_8_20_14_0_80_42_15]|uniref:STAS/SEC14 domain-containing protein n=1 Tax=Candidatus Aquitaenariimonas noxiae TaxID=1974741 RepID=A0A2J0L3B1_9BACT|nr:MAG: hypothetical protein COS99_03810 [Candidatus Omnitrophica bacterium CG07_land_8_20_14_0_80_42_15]
MNHKIIYEEGLLSVKTSGKMNAGDFIAMAKDILRHPQWLPNGNVIFDHTALEFDDVPLSDLEKIRAFHMSNEKIIGSGKSAIVVKDGLSKKWHKLWSQGKKIKTGNRSQIFENYNDATSWLK